MKYYARYPSLMIATILIGISSCGNDPETKKPGNNADTATSSEVATKEGGYDFQKVETTEMKKKLKEISGIYFLKENLFAAIQDESGKIFIVDFSNGDIREEITFGEKGDYEDVAADNNYYYVLESSGKIYRVPRSGDLTQLKTFQIPFKKHIEFESMYLDEGGENIILICKNCPGKKNNLVKYAYGFNLKTELFADEALFTIDLGSLPATSNPDDLDVKPSATAIHPLEKKLYVLCSVGKMLLKCDLQGKIEKAWPLNSQIYNQPEGIAFTPNGDMYISNEAGEGDKGNILKLVYRK